MLPERPFQSAEYLDELGFVKEGLDQQKGTGARVKKDLLNKYHSYVQLTLMSVHLNICFVNMNKITSTGIYFEEELFT